VAPFAAVASLIGFFPKRGFVRPVDSVLAPDGNLESEVTGKVYLRFDALVSEAPDYTAVPTQSQVEDGATISDHVTLKPVKLVVQGIITDTPVSLTGQFSAAFHRDRKWLV
jgi:ribosomal protein L15